jgi:hypothetical protein
MSMIEPVNLSERIRARAWRGLMGDRNPARWERLTALAREAHTIKDVR